MYNNSFLTIIKINNKFLKALSEKFEKKIRSLENINQYLKNGADKISINQITRNNPKFVQDSSKEFGSQCIVVSVDTKVVDGIHYLYAHEENKILEIENIDLPYFQTLSSFIIKLLQILLILIIKNHVQILG